MMLRLIAVCMMIATPSWSQSDEDGLKKVQEAVLPVVRTSMAEMADRDQKEKEKREKQPSCGITASPPVAGQPPRDLVDHAPTDLDSTEPLSVDQAKEFIKSFTENSLMLQKARDNFTYHQWLQVLDLDEDPTVSKKEAISIEGMDWVACTKQTKFYAYSGRKLEENRLIFTNEKGRREEKVEYPTYPKTLKCFDFNHNDRKNLAKVLPFMLTPDHVEQYEIRSIGSKKLGEVSTRVFQVWPKKIEEDQRYFQGYIFVDEASRQIVKGIGLPVPPVKKEVFTWFTTTFQPVFGKWSEKWYYFPSRTFSKELLQFENGTPECGDYPMQQVVVYDHYKEEGSSVKILPAGDATATPPQEQKPPENQEKKP